jgi:predicted signal transduction protein with EAL and GGDEF domain
VEAVMEVYSDVTSLVDDMERGQWKILAGVLGGLSAVYALILWILLRYRRLLSEQEAQRLAQEERIRHQAYHDDLTGLPNRASFAEQLDAMTRRARRAGWAFAVMFLDLDRFKVVNDSLGHHAGDQLLRVAATRIQRCIRDSDMLFRMGATSSRSSSRTSADRNRPRRSPTASWKRWPNRSSSSSTRSGSPPASAWPCSRATTPRASGS